MKYLLLTLLFFPSLAFAQTAVTKETADTYFNNCLKTQSTQEFSQQAQQTFCACTAGRMTQFFTMEDMQTMVSQGPQARLAYNKMIVDIYAQCMEAPTRERYYQQCTQSPGVNQKICHCISDAIALHLKNDGSQIFSQILSRDPAIVDPYAALENDPDFTAFKQSAGQSCLR